MRCGRRCGARSSGIGVDHVDLYQIHGPISLRSNRALADALAAVVDEGLTRAVGVSNYSTKETERIHAALAANGVPLASNQVEYSLLRRRPETSGLLETCRRPGRRAPRLLADRDGPAHRQVLGGQPAARQAELLRPPDGGGRPGRRRPAPHRQRRTDARPARSRCGGSSRRAPSRSRAPRTASRPARTPAPSAGTSPTTRWPSSTAPRSSPSAASRTASGSTAEDGPDRFCVRSSPVLETSARRNGKGDTVTGARYEGAVDLRSGRRLGFAEFGPAHGHPIIWFHGTPGRPPPDPADGPPGGRGARPADHLDRAAGRRPVHLAPVRRDRRHRRRRDRGGRRARRRRLRRRGPLRRRALRAGHGRAAAGPGLRGGRPRRRGADRRTRGVRGRAGCSTLARRVQFAHAGVRGGRRRRPVGPAARSPDRSATRSTTGSPRCWARATRRSSPPRACGRCSSATCRTAAGSSSGPRCTTPPCSGGTGASASPTSRCRCAGGTATSIRSCRCPRPRRRTRSCRDVEFHLRPGESHLGGFAAAHEVLEALAELRPDPRRRPVRTATVDRSVA